MSQEINFELPIGPSGQNGMNGTNGTGYRATSTTSLSLADSGDKTFTTQANLAYSPGARIRATSASDTSKWMEGIVSDYTDTDLVVTMDKKNGTGSFADWNINITGEIGSTGTNGTNGTDGADGSGYSATSGATVLIETGTKEFTTQAGLAYVTGLRVRVANSGTDYVEGTVVSYLPNPTPTTFNNAYILTITVDRTVGSGSYATWTIGLAGDVGADGATYALTPSTFTLDSSNTFTGASSNRIQRANPSGVITTANRVITLVAGSTDNYFEIIFPVQFTVGAGFTYKITQQGGSDLVILKAGTWTPRKYQCVYQDTTYIVTEVPIITPSSTVNDSLPIKKLLVANYDYDTDGGSVGAISLSEVLPVGAIVDVDQITIKTNTIVTSGGSATISLGYTGAAEAFDYPRAYNTYPYTATTATARGTRYGTSTGSTNVTINERRGRWTTASLTTASGASTTATLTNSFITAAATVKVWEGTYSGTIVTDGIPKLYSGNPGSGSIDIPIHNIHGTNALDGTLTIHFEVANEGVSGNVVKITSASNIVVTIAGAALTAGNFDVQIPYTIDE